MHEEISQLKDLKSRIDNTWGLLKIDEKQQRMKQLEVEMQEAGFWSNQDRAKKVTQEHDELKTEVELWIGLQTEVHDLLGLSEELVSTPEDDMRVQIQSRVPELVKQYEKMEFFLLMNGRHDENSAIVAVHSGSGGTEAQDWAEMLQRMVVRYCEKKQWTITMLDESRGQEAGIKSAVFRVEGRYVYGHLKSEHGTHRLVRISPFDSEQMRHTSFALIEVIPEVEQDVDVEIDPKDLRIDTFMAGGKGGQSVNTTYSAVRIVHLPTNITVQCQNERSQLQNRETAMKVLRSKLLLLKEEQEEKDRLELRGEYKSAEWGNQIRSYVLHPYKMVKDVRTRHETTDPDAVLNGELDPFIEAYLRWDKAGRPKLVGGTKDEE